MANIYSLLKAGALLVGEVRGVKSETVKRFDKSDKNAAPIVFGVVKVNLEMLADGTPVMLSAYLDAATVPEEFEKKLNLKRGDVIAVAVSKQELKTGVRKASCGEKGIFLLDKAEVDKLRSS